MLSISTTSDSKDVCCCVSSHFSHGRPSVKAPKVRLSVVIIHAGCILFNTHFWNAVWALRHATYHQLKLITIEFQNKLRMANSNWVSHNGNNSVVCLFNTYSLSFSLHHARKNVDFH